MTVQSRDIKARSSHLTTAEQMSKAEPGLYRGMAVLLWLLSYFGNVLMFGGGWERLGQHLWSAVGISLLYQAVCTVIQFICCRRWYNPVYLLALTASGIPAFLGYRPLVAAPLTRWATGMSGDVFASWATVNAADPGTLTRAAMMHLLMAVVLIAADVIPERIFVKH